MLEHRTIRCRMRCQTPRTLRVEQRSWRESSVSLFSSSLPRKTARSVSSSRHCSSSPRTAAAVWSPKLLSPAAIVQVEVNSLRVSCFATRAAQGIAELAGGDQNEPAFELVQRLQLFEWIVTPLDQ